MFVVFMWLEGRIANAYAGAGERHLALDFVNVMKFILVWGLVGSDVLYFVFFY